MNVISDKRTEKFLENLTETDRARINRTVQFFEEEGFLLDTRYLKKLTSRIWELRPGRIRLLFGVVKGEAIVVNAFMKKTQKTPLKELKLAERRLTEYEYK